jgi:hypothetical protein
VISGLEDRRLRGLLPLLLLGLLSCGSSSGPPDLGESLSVLFVGNSLTYTENLPALVEGLSRAAGLDRVRVASVAKPDYSLEDHWNDGEALDSIGQGGWDAVVLQQGPSSLLASQAHLLEWTGRFAERIRGAGAKPAVYMVWPPADGSWDGVVTAYTAAGEPGRPCSGPIRRSSSTDPTISIPPGPERIWPPWSSSAG